MARTGTRRSSLRALGHRDFALFFIGNLVSNCGTWFQNIAQALLVYRLTHSSFWVGAANFAQFIGVVLLAPWAGAAADRFDRRRLIIATQIAATVASAVLAWLVAAGKGSVPVVLILALALGATTAFSTPAMQAIIPALVPRDDLHAAVAMNAVTFNLARAVGPVVGALVVARLGVAWGIGLNALSYVLFAAVLLFVHVHGQGERRSHNASLVDSIRTVRRDGSLMILLVIVAAVSITMDPVSTLTPQYAAQLFHKPDTFAGALIGAFGLGAVIGSVIPLHDTHEPGRRIALMLAVFSAGMVAFALLPLLALVMVALGVGGFGYLLGQTNATTQLQIRVSDRERGRVMALWSVAFLGTRPIAALIDGGLAALLGPRPTTLVLALPTLVAAGLALRLGPSKSARGQSA